MGGRVERRGRQDPGDQWQGFDAGVRRQAGARRHRGRRVLRDGPVRWQVVSAVGLRLGSPWFTADSAVSPPLGANFLVAVRSISLLLPTRTCVPQVWSRSGPKSVASIEA